jgi:hypothetical protein
MTREAGQETALRTALVNWFADLNDGMRSISSGRFAAGEPERNADAVLAIVRAALAALAAHPSPPPPPHHRTPGSRYGWRWTSGCVERSTPSGRDSRSRTLDA